MFSYVNLVNDDIERQKELMYRSHEKVVPTSVCLILYCISFTQHCHPKYLTNLQYSFTECTLLLNLYFTEEDITI